MVKVIIVALAVLLGGWLLGDGVRAITTGHYTTPKSGPYAGQLGPWSKAVAAVGIDPLGKLMKIVHIALGSLWVIGAVLLFVKAPIGRAILLGCSVCSIWYIPFGAVVGIIEVLLLFLPAIRSKF